MGHLRSFKKKGGVVDGDEQVDSSADS
jgi:hypothetical protein